MKWVFLCLGIIGTSIAANIFAGFVVGVFQDREKLARMFHALRGTRNRIPAGAESAMYVEHKALHQSHVSISSDPVLSPDLSRLIGMLQHQALQMTPLQQALYAQRMQNTQSPLFGALGMQGAKQSVTGGVLGGLGGGIATRGLLGDIFGGLL